MRKLVGILFTASLVCASISLADGVPPRDLHLHGDHWTAWYPPPIDPDQQVHIIERGDTLWDLAARFFGDPYLWPQIWEQNTYILDAHWIYPGDPLALPGLAQGQLGDAGLAQPPIDTDEALAAAIPEDLGDDGDDDVRFDRGQGSNAPVPIGHESDIYCSGYIGELEEVYALTVTGSEHDYLNPHIVPGRPSNIEGTYGKAETQKYGLALGDVVYLDGGRSAGVTPGALYTAIEPGAVVRHPKTEEVLGRYYFYLGRLRVLSVQAETSIAEVSSACTRLTVGSMLKPFEPEPVPLRRLTPMRPVNFPAPDDAVEQGARIVYSHGELVALGVGHLVFIDQGVNHDVTPGDIYTVYRRTEPGIPPIVLGELGVLSVGQNTALARVLASRYTVYIGDALLPK